VHGESAAFPQKKGCWESWGSYIRLQQPRKVDVRDRQGKSSTGRACQEPQMPLAGDSLGNPLWPNAQLRLSGNSHFLVLCSGGQMTAGPAQGGGTPVRLAAT